jgi:hypothetical protein
MPLVDCQETVTHSRVKFEEKGKKVIFLNPDCGKFLRTRVDGCLKDCSPACDWVATKPNSGDVLVELKGSDVSHALEQLVSTAHYWTTKGYRAGELAALVVCSQYPRISTGIQRARLKFRRHFKAPLHVVSRNREFDIERLFGLGSNDRGSPACSSPDESI